MALRDLFVSIAFDVEDRALRNLNDETDDYIDNLKRGDRAISDMDDTMQDSSKSMTRELRGIGDSAERLSSDINGIEDPNISGRQATGQMRNVEGAASDASNEVRNMPNPDIETKQSESRLDNLKEKASDLKGMLAGVAGALGGSAAASGIENLEGLAANLETRLGVSSEEAENLRSQIIDIYGGGYGSNIADVEQSVRLTRLITGDSGSELEKQSKDMLRIADAWGVGVEEVADAARANSQSMGVDFTESLNTIGTGMQSGLNVSGDYLETMQEFSPAFNRIGADSGDMLSILQSGMDAGIRDTDRMADSINEFGIRMQETDNESLLKVAESLTDSEEEAQKLADTWQSDFAKGGEDAQRVTDEVVEGLLDMEGEVGYMETAVGLFGTMWEDTSGRVGEAISDAEGKTTDLKDATTELEDQYDTTGQKINRVWRSVNNLYDTLDQRTGGVLSNVAESFGQALPLLGAFALGKGGLEGIKNGAKTATRYVGRFGSRIFGLSNPLGWIVTFMGGVAETLITHWDSISETASEGENAFEKAFRGIWATGDYYGNGVIGILNNIIDTVNNFSLLDWGLPDIPNISKFNVLGEDTENYLSQGESAPTNSVVGSPGGAKSNREDSSDTQIQGIGATYTPPGLIKGGLVKGGSNTLAVTGDGADDEAVVPLNRKVYKRMGEGIASATTDNSPAAKRETPTVNLNVQNNFSRDTTPEQAERIGRANAREAYREWKKFKDKFDREEAAREV
ncbi:phage tail tape measure protein [Salibacterium sp. K-3]